MAVLRASSAGVADPGDMDLLKRIFDELCRERRLGQGSPAAEELAKTAMELFTQGVVDEKELIEELRNHLDRR